MPVSTTYTCDGCGSVKRETNHWFFLRWLDNVIEVCPFNLTEVRLGFYFCSEGCLIKKISQVLEKWRVEC